MARSTRRRPGTVLDGVADLPSVHVITPAEVASRYPVDEIYDLHADELGHLPYTPEFFVALATAIARRIHAIGSIPFKVAALDCDETLWAGICGEDGPYGVTLDAPRRALQEFIAARPREGMLLTLCSKNNEEDVLETFRAYPEMHQVARVAPESSVISRTSDGRRVFLLMSVEKTDLLRRGRSGIGRRRWRTPFTAPAGFQPMARNTRRRP